MKEIYLDHAATTPVDPKVLEDMLPYFTEKFGNANSQHSIGKVCTTAVDNAREVVAKAIGAHTNEIYFTGSGTEADNWAIKGTANAFKNKGKHIIVSAIEHHAIINSAKWLEDNGFTVSYLPVDEYGVVKLDELKRLLTPSTTLVSVMYANNEVGTIEPIKEIVKIAHNNGTLVHTDCVQAMGAIPVDVNDLGCDMLSISAHKFYGPKGIGALYIRNGLKIDKFIIGGGQERNQRGGTTNTPAVVGMASAISLAVSELDKNAKYISSLRDAFVKRVMEEIPFVKYNGDPINRLPNNANFSFKYIEGEGILMLLDLAKIAVSSGSACSSGTLDPSHVLLAMGVDVALAHGSIRFTFGKENTMEEVNYTVDTLVKTIDRLRKMSPLFTLNEGEKVNV